MKTRFHVLAAICLVTSTSARAQDALKAYDYSAIGKAPVAQWVIDGKEIHDAYVQLMKPRGAVIVSKEGSREYSYESLSEPMRLVCDQLQAEAGNNASGSLENQIGRLGGHRMIGKVVSVVREGVIVDASEFALASTDAVPMLDVCWMGRGLMDVRWAPSSVPSAWYLLTNYARRQSVLKDDVIGLIVYPRAATFTYLSLLGERTVHIVSPFPEQLP